MRLSAVALAKAGGRGIAKVFHDGGEFLDGVIDFIVGRQPAETESNGGRRHVLRTVQGKQHVRRSGGSGTTGRSRRHGNVGDTDRDYILFTCHS